MVATWLKYVTVMLNVWQQTYIWLPNDFFQTRSWNVMIDIKHSITHDNTATYCCLQWQCCFCTPSNKLYWQQHHCGKQSFLFGYKYLLHGYKLDWMTVYVYLIYFISLVCWIYCLHKYVRNNKECANDIQLLTPKWVCQ